MSEQYIDLLDEYTGVEPGINAGDELGRRTPEITKETGVYAPAPDTEDLAVPLELREETHTELTCITEPNTTVNPHVIPIEDKSAIERFLSTCFKGTRLVLVFKDGRRIECIFFAVYKGGLFTVISSTDNSPERFIREYEYGLVGIDNRKGYRVN